MGENEIPEDHPRAESLKTREKLTKGLDEKVVAKAGLIAHGRGEAFDYILGEKTYKFAEEAMKAALASFLVADHPVFSVNGNVAALAPKDYVKLAQEVGAQLEVNLFYRREERERAIKNKLLNAGAETVLGVDEENRTTIPEISHSRRIVDKRGIYKGDVIFVPLEDGDRTKALRKIGKKVVTIDLNPLSRTAQWAHITIVDNLVRSIPKMIRLSKKMEDMRKKELETILEQYDNIQILKEALAKLQVRLKRLSNEGRVIEQVDEYPPNATENSRKSKI